MKYTLQRIRSITDDSATGGVLTDPFGEIICYILERPYVNNQPFISCVESDIYKIVKHHGKKYPDAWKVEDKHGRSACVFHAANKASELMGCFAPATYLKSNAFDGKLWAVRSKSALDDLYARWDQDADAGEDIFLNIYWG